MVNYSILRYTPLYYSRAIAENTNHALFNRQLRTKRSRRRIRVRGHTNHVLQDDHLIAVEWRVLLFTDLATFCGKPTRPRRGHYGGHRFYSTRTDLWECVMFIIPIGMYIMSYNVIYIYIYIYY